MKVLGSVVLALVSVHADPQAVLTQAVTACVTATPMPACYSMAPPPVVVQGSTINNAQIDAFCHSLCLLPMKNYYTALGSCMASAVTTYVNAVVGTTSPEVAAATAKSITAAYSTLPDIFTWMCTKKDGTDEYCITNYVRLAADLSAAAASGDARTALCNYYGNMGCCLASLESAYLKTANLSVALGLGCPDLQMPPPCVAVGTTAPAYQAQFTIANLNLDLLNTTARDAVIAALRQDLATCTGAGATAGSFSVSQCSGNPAQCTIVLRAPDGTTSSTTVQGTALAVCLAGAGPGWAATLAALSTMGVTPAGSLGLEGNATVKQTTISGDSYGSQNSGSTLAPALLVGMLAVLAA